MDLGLQGLGSRALDSVCICAFNVLSGKYQFLPIPSGLSRASLFGLPSQKLPSPNEWSFKNVVIHGHARESLRSRFQDVYGLPDSLVEIANLLLLCGASNLFACPWAKRKVPWQLLKKKRGP